MPGDSAGASCTLLVSSQSLRDQDVYCLQWPADWFEMCMVGMKSGGRLSYWTNHFPPARKTGVVRRPSIESFRRTRPTRHFAQGLT